MKKLRYCFVGIVSFEFSFLKYIKKIVPDNMMIFVFFSSKGTEMAEQSVQKISPGAGLEMGTLLREFASRPLLQNTHLKAEEVSGSILDNDVETGK